jgi:nucleotide-binding universal stress UspA family protein
MTDIKKILFPTDFSETAQHAFQQALVLADHWHARIQVLHVVYPEYEGMDLPMMSAQMTNKRVELAKSLCNQFIDTGTRKTEWIRKHNIEIQPLVEVGAAPSIISSTAEDIGADLIIMGTQGEHPIIERIFGTISAHVLDLSKVDVLLIPQKARLQRFNAIAYATDLTIADPYHIWETSRLFELLADKLYCVHVFTDQDESVELKMNELKSYIRQNPPSISIELVGLDGDSVEDHLQDFIRDRSIDILVMYSPHRSLFERLFHRSHTRQMAYHSEIPLWVIKSK